MPERRVVLAVPGDPDTPTGGYGYDRRVAAELRAGGWDVLALRLPDGFPAPDAAALRDAYGLLAACPSGVPVIVDGLALGAMPRVGDALGADRPLIALVHHPLALESGLDAARAARLRDSERAALASASRVIATSHATAATLRADYGVPAARLVVAVPGTDPAPAARGGDGTVPALLSVGTLVPRKGHDLLIVAAAHVADLRWRLTIVGDDTRDPATARALRDAVRDAGLADRIHFAGAVDAPTLDALFDGADLFVLASRHEGYGMAYAEAIARALPVLGTRAGAIAESVPPGAGWLVEPDDVNALADALRTLLADAGARRRLADGARRARDGQPRWADTAARIADTLRAAA